MLQFSEERRKGGLILFQGLVLKHRIHHYNKTRYKSFSFTILS